MNQDKIHDALNLLDDDMIEVVENLRNKTKNKRKNKWIRYLSVAACICIVLVGVFGVGNLIKLQLEGGKKHSNGLSNNFGNLGNDKNHIIKGEKGDVIVAGDEAPSVIVKIKKWHDNGFEGEVSGIVDTDVFEVGTKVIAEFEEGICVAVTDGKGIKYIDGTPDKSDFPAGSNVCVQFIKKEKKVTGLFKKTDVLYVTVISEVNE